MVFAKGVTEADMPPLAVVVCAYSTAGVVFAVSHSWRKYWNNGRSMSLACYSRVAKVRRTIATGRKARAMSCVTWTRTSGCISYAEVNPNLWTLPYIDWEKWKWHPRCWACGKDCRIAGISPLSMSDRIVLGLRTRHRRAASRCRMLRSEEQGSTQECDVEVTGFCRYKAVNQRR